MPQDRVSQKTSNDARLPSTLTRSSKKAQRTFRDTLASAEDEYRGDDERAHRVAYGALKHSYEKVGDHWEAKDEKGPSDEQSEQTGTAARTRPRRSRGGVDANASKAHLLDVARRLDISGRSRMRKAELADAIEEENRRRTTAAR